MKKKSDKRAIALISIMIIITVLLLLSGIVTYAGKEIIITSKETTFIKNMETINDSVEEYYIVNGSIPNLEDEIGISVSQYKENIRILNGNKAEEKLSSEIIKNGDEEAIFYEIDISKIGIDEIVYGTKENEYDFYLVSNVSHKVYYYPGYEIGNELHFSGIDIIDN